jgi:hypothetical protein
MPFPIAEDPIDPPDDLQDVDFFVWTGRGVSSQKKPVVFDTMNSVTDEQPIMPVDDDIADLKFGRIL